jgi:hypothetical protein
VSVTQSRSSVVLVVISGLTVDASMTIAAQGTHTGISRVALGVGSSSIVAAKTIAVHSIIRISISCAVSEVLA